ncbi:hypothetical protein [Clostridium butyricum]|uniref:hypothetical protein n=1 Tax=Clostridium butyricum TaxID=1492 RepID=UPI00039F44F8|nr:hypothetical protein [Clostridium butyricum]MBZ5747911.1 hypothetical protein [Clostridium butyricum]
MPGEGIVGTFDELNALRKKGDNLTPHHMPSGEYIRRWNYHVDGVTIYGKGWKT